MTDPVLARGWSWGALLIAASAGLAGLLGGASLGFGVVAGGAWNLASLWCLTRLLGAWLGPHPSRRRAIIWLLIKFPALYLTAFGLLWRLRVSVLGFGLGFTVVLLGALAMLLIRTQTMTRTRSYGR